MIGLDTNVLEIILRSKQLIVDQAEHVVRALRAFRAGNADFADCLIERMAASAGCAQTMTFDSAAAKTAGMTRCATSPAVQGGEG